MTYLSWTILGTGFLCLVIGLFNMRRKDPEHFQVNLTISWLLIALFPALVIFSFFPQSSISGSILGFSVSGAVGLFVFIWWYGTRNAESAFRIDGLNEQIRALRTDLEKAQAVQKTNGNASQPKVLTQTEVFCYSMLKRHKRKIALITGNIHGVKCADVWVNSENTNMQMSRFYERSISGTIRYLGARKDQVGDVVEDSIMDEVLKHMGSKTAVQPATVLVTGSGQLQETHNVKRIFHVASVRGQVAAGYQPIDNISMCIFNALEKVDCSEFRVEQFKTILFPLMGTGAGRAAPEKVADELISAAIQYLEEREATSIETVYFLTWTDRDLSVCRSVLEGKGLKLAQV